jgi:TRAP-type C4-dicarboxylate transport system substrate-binding protein
MPKSLMYAAAITAMCLTGATTVRSQSLEPLRLSIIGLPSMVNGWKYVQQPAFSKNIPEASGGKLTIDAKPHDQAGIDLSEATRLTSDGVLNISYGAFAIHAGDDPRLEGIDLPGVGLTVDQARTAVQAWRPVVEDALLQKFKVKLLSVHPNTMQAVFCKGGINSLNDFRGKKVRVFGTAMADYMKELGAVTVNIPFPEVLPALQQGVADCGITSPANGNTARWWEVTRDLLVMPVGGWGLGFFAANVEWWNTVPPTTQTFLLNEFKKIEDAHWQQAAYDLKDGVSCNTGDESCRFGVRAEEGKRMRVVLPSTADNARHAEVMSVSVLKNWARRCGKPCAQQWNETTGKVVGLVAPIE